MGAGRGGPGRDRVFARAYKAQGDKVVAIPFRPGITDDEYTEVLRGPLEEDDEIVIEASGPALEQAPDRSQQNQQRGGRRMGRGPRFL